MGMRLSLGKANINAKDFVRRKFPGDGYILNLLLGLKILDFATTLRIESCPFSLGRSLTCQNLSYSINPGDRIPLMKSLTKALLFFFVALLVIPPQPLARTVSTGTAVNTFAPALQRRRARSSRRTPRRSGRSYINVEGIRVPSPVHSRSVPAGATAQCGDGTYSFSRHRRGTCSRHGGVARWL
jgi:hypothetical protein